LHLLREKREVGRESSFMNTDKIPSRPKRAETELAQYIDSLRLDDPTIFGRLQSYLNVLSGLLCNMPQIRIEVISNRDVESVIEEFRRWKDEVGTGFSQIGLELSKQENA